jgi:hypothetical protein
VTEPKFDESDDLQIVDVGERQLEDGTVRTELPRIDVLLPVTIELGERGTPRREAKSDQEIHSELLPGFDTGQLCRLHGAAGCTACRLLEQSYIKAENNKTIRSWWLSPAVPGLIWCRSNDNKIQKYLAERRSAINIDSLNAAVTALKKDLRWGNPSRDRIILPEPDSRPLITTVPAPEKPKVSKRGRPRKPKEELPVKRSVLLPSKTGHLI